MLQRGRCFSMENDFSRLFKYVRMDVYRAFFSWRFLIATVFVALSLWFACLDAGFFNSVMTAYEDIGSGMSLLLVFIFCAYAYSSCFSEDFENSCYRYSVIRGNTWVYVLSKVITICLITTVSMILGTLIFVLSLSCFVPWIPKFQLAGSTYDFLTSSGKFPQLLANNHFILYYTCLALCMGLYASMLSLISAWVSLYVSNKMLVLTIPVIVFYIVQLLSITLGNLVINGIFIFQGYTIRNTTTTFIIIVLTTILVTTLMYFAILHKVERRISNE